MTWFCIRISCTIGARVKWPSSCEQDSCKATFRLGSFSHLVILPPLVAFTLVRLISGCGSFTTRIAIVCSVELCAPNMDYVLQSSEQNSLNLLVQVRDPVIQVCITFQVHAVDLTAFRRKIRDSMKLCLPLLEPCPAVQKMLHGYMRMSRVLQQHA